MKKYVFFICIENCVTARVMCTLYINIVKSLFCNYTADCAIHIVDLMRIKFIFSKQRLNNKRTKMKFNRNERTKYMRLQRAFVHREYINHFHCGSSSIALIIHFFNAQAQIQILTTQEEDISAPKWIQMSYRLVGPEDVLVDCFNIQSHFIQKTTILV